MESYGALQNPMEPYGTLWRPTDPLKRSPIDHIDPLNGFVPLQAYSSVASALGMDPHAPNDHQGLLWITWAGIVIRAHRAP